MFHAATCIKATVKEITVSWGLTSISGRLELSIRILTNNAEESSTGQGVKLQG